jgi:hypothetical protein
VTKPKKETAMNLKLNNLVSRLLRSASVAVLLAVASGCGGPIQEEIDASAQTAQEAPVTMRAQGLPTHCSEDDYGRMLCYITCNDGSAECYGACTGEENTYECRRACAFDYYACHDQCDRQYC